MFKKILQIHWAEKKHTKFREGILAKSFARLRKKGWKAVKEKIEAQYKELGKDLPLKSLLDKKYTTFITRSVFALFFLLSASYILFIRTELYESSTDIVVKTLGSDAGPSTLAMSLLGAGSSSQMQDSKIIEAYVLSHDVFEVLDKKFHLSRHYKSDAIDILQRLPKDATKEEVLEFYRAWLQPSYDEISGILTLAYRDTTPKQAQSIVLFLIKDVEKAYNEFNRKKAQKQLAYIEKEHKKAKQKLDESIKKLEEYQNKHLLLDPHNKAEALASIIAALQTQLTQKKIELSTKESYLGKENYEISKLKKEIEEIQKSIEKQKESLSGSDKARLNKLLFEFENLKTEVELNAEIYKNVLLKLETTKLEIMKDSKILSILSKPNLPEGYTYPNKQKELITLLILTLLAYGIFSMIMAIIKDHKE